MATKKQPLLGAHMPISSGFAAALTKGESIGCTAIQIFTKSNRQWRARTISEQEKEEFISARTKSPIQSIMVHASYLINLASPQSDLAEKSLASLIMEIERCEFLSIPLLILHPGSCGNGPRDNALEQVAALLNKALAKTSTCIVLLETMAGQGSSIGSCFQELAAIFHLIQDKKRIGFCLDTCHLFAAGYDFCTEDAYHSLMNQCDKILGFENVRAFHINDSKMERGSHVDRHACIGEGKIGLVAFTLLMNDPRFAKIPKILETPHNNFVDFEKDIKTLKGLIKH